MDSPIDDLATVELRPSDRGQNWNSRMDALRRPCTSLSLLRSSSRHAILVDNNNDDKLPRVMQWCDLTDSANDDLATVQLRVRPPSDRGPRSAEDWNLPSSSRMDAVSRPRTSFSLHRSSPRNAIFVNNEDEDHFSDFSSDDEDAYANLVSYDFCTSIYLIHSLHTFL